MMYWIARIPLRVFHWLPAGGVALLLLAFWSGGVWGAAGDQAARPPAGQAGPAATPGQDFQDVVPSDPFYPFLHNLKAANIVSGYTCQPGGPNDPCVPPDNLPYYHPGVAVSR